MNEDESTLFATLAKLQGGTVIEKLDSSITNLVSMTRIANRRGKLTLVLDVIPVGNDDKVQINTTITIKEPLRKTRGDAFFIDGNSRLVKEDPRQDNMFPDPDPKEPPPLVKRAW